MRRIPILLILFGLIVLSGGALLTALGAGEAAEPAPQAEEASPSPPDLPFYTMEEVARRAEAGECWMVIHDKVYDLTEFVARHPGGKAILEGCGKDATELFETRPMGSGTPHSERARALLDRYLIGYLEEEETR
ncbi:cytochrome b5 [Spirochaeta thermophila DSM 6578]|uniref:Cytochrome b5 n=1 Tax=Winmispira thermophila (strain ATCC 700085 / DSM 6578 / Z-1203) TaxID=869211 RepID=G0GAP0_WINT7|nr:cytochrome b5-like heme/steroid binding domain-containing protein [Spirochaeta thermophila]AEJ61005.1 cytochrome b5 [Spirochaeta thermophila DSM 6578]